MSLPIIVLGVVLVFGWGIYHELKCRKKRRHISQFANGAKVLVLVLEKNTEELRRIGMLVEWYTADGVLPPKPSQRFPLNPYFAGLLYGYLLARELEASTYDMPAIMEELAAWSSTDLESFLLGSSRTCRHPDTGEAFLDTMYKFHRFAPKSWPKLP